EIQLNEEVVTRGSNTFLIIPPGCWHTTNCRRTGKRTFVHFDWEYVHVPSQAPAMTFYPGTPQKKYLRPAPSFVSKDVLRGEIGTPALINSLMERLELMLGSPIPQEQLASRGVLQEVLLR